MSQEIKNRITTLVENFDRQVQATDDAAWENQSPCEEWKARDVVGHVVGNLGRIASGINGATTPPAPFDRGGDVKSQWNRTRDDFLQAVNTGDLSRVVPGPAGEMPIEQVIGRFIANDVMVHTWDLARSVGGDDHLDPEMVKGAYSGMKPMDELLRRPGFFGPKLDAPDGADMQTEFLAFLGRKA